MSCLSIFLSLFVLAHLWEQTTAVSSLNILLLGGNGLIGGHTTRRLKEAGHRLTALNRGSQVWDWPTVLAGHFERTIKCNRVDPLTGCEDFQKFLKTKPPKFDLVIDFSGFEVHMIDTTVPALAGLFDRYVYISTDSVYEVSKSRGYNGNWKEDEAIRPDDLILRQELAEKDQYAEFKLRCEEQMRGYAKKLKFSLIMLRLPDVIGQRDSTLRFWTYMIVTELAVLSKQTLQMPAFSRYWPMSLVYVDDVARFLVLLANQDTSAKAWPSNGTAAAYNFANPETLTLENVIRRIIVLQRLDVKLHTVKDYFAGKPRHLFPSVTVGAMNVSLVTTTLPFSFTPWDTAFRATVKFYRQYTNDLHERDGLQHIQKLHDHLTRLAMLPHFDYAVWNRFLGQKRVEL